MKAITCRPSEAMLTVSGRLWIHSHDWEPEYRGPLILHAGNPVRQVVGICRLVECVPMDHLRGMPGFIGPYEVSTLFRHMRTALLYDPGPILWILHDAVKLAEPIACNGHRRLWTPSEQMLRLLRKRPALSRFFEVAK